MAYPAGARRAALQGPRRVERITRLRPAVGKAKIAVVIKEGPRRGPVRREEPLTRLTPLIRAAPPLAVKVEEAGVLTVGRLGPPDQGPVKAFTPPARDAWRHLTRITVPRIEVGPAGGVPPPGPTSAPVAGPALNVGVAQRAVAPLAGLMAAPVAPLAGVREGARVAGVIIKRRRAPARREVGGDPYAKASALGVPDAGP